MLLLSTKKSVFPQILKSQSKFNYRTKFILIKTTALEFGRCFFYQPKIRLSQNLKNPDPHFNYFQMLLLSTQNPSFPKILKIPIHTLTTSKYFFYQPKIRLSTNPKNPNPNLTIQTKFILIKTAAIVLQYLYQTKLFLIWKSPAVFLK